MGPTGFTATGRNLRCRFVDFDWLEHLMHASENHIRCAVAVVSLCMWAAPGLGAGPRFAEPVRYEAGQWSAPPSDGADDAAVDVDGDGYGDLVDVDARRDVVLVRYGTRAGAVRRRSYAAGADPLDAVAADLDGDGRADLVVAGPAGIRVLRNSGGRTFAEPAPLPAPGRPVDLVAGDLDADGRIDLVVMDGDTGGMWVLLNRTPRVGDLNGDDRVDVEDMLELLGVWGPCTACDEDLTGDDHVDVVDMIELLEHWTEKNGD